jgi:hypothetical protein
LLTFFVRLANLSRSARLGSIASVFVWSRRFTRIFVFPIGLATTSLR